MGQGVVGLDSVHSVYLEGRRDRGELPLVQKRARKVSELSDLGNISGEFTCHFLLSPVEKRRGMSRRDT
jgi:hypothetical protein